MADGTDSVLSSAVSKVKRHVLPLFVIMFIVNYIDRVNIGFVRSHMEHDLGIGAAAYGLGAGLFFIGYALFEVPSNILLQKVGARIWLTRIMLTWGIVAACMAFIQNETHFYILRFLLGVAEAGFFPGVIYYFTRWLPGVERGKAIAIFLSGSAIASLISGPLSGLLLQITGFGMKGWQWMYFIEGMFSVGNLGGFVAPTTFGLLEEHTGSIQGGLYGLTVTSIIAAIIVFAARNTPKPGATPVAAIHTPATH
ncbi:MFS transporter [Pseudomonas savastanoi]|nr:MFS transporter [Pseudomonas savastanoi]